MFIPTTRKGLQKFDELPPADTVVAAWTDAGVYPEWHAKAQHDVRASMPVLVRAIERLAANVSPSETFEA